jgi:periplasmic protein CpxP/Spy
MKTFKSLAVIALFAIGSLAVAQNPGQGGNRMNRSVAERAKAEVTSLVTTLGLDATQTLKVLEISTKYAQKDSVRFAEMRNSGAQMDREAMMTQMRATQEAKNTEIQAVLTPEQITKYKAFLEERQQRRGQRPQQ